MISDLRRIGMLVLAGALFAGCGASGSREGQDVTLPPVVVQKGDPVLPAASGYVGSERCGICHSSIYAQWGNTLHNKMIKTVAEIGDAAFVNDPDGDGVNDFRENLSLVGNSAFLAYGTDAPKLSISGGKYFITIGSVGYEIRRVVGGNGYWKQRYQTRIGRSYYTLPVQYNEVEKTYTVYNGSDWYDASNQPRFTEAYGSDALVVRMGGLNNDTDPDPDKRRKGTAVSYENQCGGCHQTGFAVQVGTTSYGGTPVEEVVTGYVELNVGCEACHGPGAAHAASHDPADIVNPGTLATGLANDVCGSCHSRGTSVTLPGISLPMQAPARLPGSTVIPFLPGNNLLHDLSATGWYVTLTTTASDFWGSVNYAATDVDEKFPLYTASRSNHQQYMDIGQGPHAAETSGVPCFGCHSPHSAANRHMIATTVKEGGVTKVTGTKEEKNTLCLACHATLGDFSGITTADVQAVANGGSSATVDTAVLGHLIRRANMDVPIDPEGTGAGRCTACHMPKTARSAALTSLDTDGKEAGDIRSHTMKVVLPNTSVVDAPNTFFNTSLTDNSVSASMPLACSACHKAATAGSTFAGDYELYGWSRSVHADYLDEGIGGYTDRLDRSAATEAEYNSASNSACVPCHTGAGYVAALAGDTPTAHFIPPTEKNFLTCATCHDSAAPASKKHVRQIGNVVFPSGLSVTTGGNSKVCFTCHGGRNSKSSVDAAAASSDFDFTHVDPHFLPAAAVLQGPLARGGYEYAGRDYSIVFASVHINASCVTCHMAAGPSGNWNLGGHSLAMTSGSDNNTTACSSLACHGPVTSFNVRGTNRQGTIASLLSLLDAALAAKGVVKADPFDSPYFTIITSAAELRAAYNYRFVSSDPGAYAHNWWYAAQLLYDSLDELDDGSLNGSVPFSGKAAFSR